MVKGLEEEKSVMGCPFVISEEGLSHTCSLIVNVSITTESERKDMVWSYTITVFCGHRCGGSKASWGHHSSVDSLSTAEMGLVS